MNRDEEHLDLLTIFHYVFAGIVALFSLFPILHVIMGVVFIVLGTSNGEMGPGEPPPAMLGWIFVIAGTFFILSGWVMAAFILAAGRMLGKRRRHLFCLVVAGIECIMVPLGTALGVFTIIVLMRPSVQAAFKADGAEWTDFPAPPQFPG